MSKTLYDLNCNFCGKYYTSKYKTLCCSRNCSNKYQAQIRKTTIDEETGLTLTQKYAKKAADTMKNSYYVSDKCKEIARNSISKLDRKSASRKTLKTRNKVGEDGLTCYQRAARKTIETKIKKGYINDPKYSDKFQLYKKTVRMHTERNIKKYGLKDLNRRDRDSYHVDHLYSIFDGFNNKVDPEIVGHIKNLQIVERFDNLSKNSKSSISLKQLFELTGNNYQKYYDDDYTELLLEKRSTTTVMNTTRKICQHCGIETNIGNYTRWHGDNCKEMTPKDAKVLGQDINVKTQDQEQKLVTGHVKLGKRTNLYLT